MLPLIVMGRISSGSCGVGTCFSVFSAVVGIGSHIGEPVFRISLKVSMNPVSSDSLIVDEKTLGSTSQSSTGNITLSSSGLV